MTRLSDSVASIQYAKAPTVDMSTEDAAAPGDVVASDGVIPPSSAVAGAVVECEGRNAMGFPMRAADLSQIPKYGVDTASSFLHVIPSQGNRRLTSSEVRLVFQAVVKEQKRSRLKTHQNTLLLSSASVHPCGGCREVYGREKDERSASSLSIVSWRYSTMRVKAPISDHARHSSPSPILNSC